MRYILLTVAAVMLMPFASFAQEADREVKVMSYNIRNSGSKDGTNSWLYRYVAAADMILDQKADIIAIQEALSDQIYFLEENFKDYKHVGKGSEDGKNKGEHTAIFWNKKNFSMVDWGTLWLSETPDLPSKSWDAEVNSTAVWALMKDKKTGNRFYVVNVDLDESGKEARSEGLQVVLDKLSAMNPDSLPVVMTGGFCMRPADPALAEVEAKMENARKSAAKTDNTGTYHNWGKNNEILDHIYHSGFGGCSEYQTVTKKYAERKFVSDHYPMTAILTF